MIQGHRTAYLWEEVWERQSWLEILGRYCIAECDKKKQIQRIVFPRYHQLAVTRLLVQTILEEGPGARYLIQHSAGSGKTASIGWSAHLLADLHDADDNKVFDTVLVVSDRSVIDSQLQDTLENFERRKGVVASITTKKGIKSDQLAAALSGDKKIVVCTIQTFPALIKKMQELSATSGKRFAVIADEAHSSQTGDAAIKLRQVLSAAELADLADGGEISMDDVLAATTATRAKQGGITYVAFTATPKAKTLELFGRCPNPNEPAGKDNLPAPFHVYSMRQAIEEEFILDVLQNYTSYKLAFRLAQDSQSLSSDEVERSSALKKLMGWVKLHPHNIAQKVQIVVEHFRNHVWPLLDGKAKAMVVVGSRKEAVRWKREIDTYIAARGYAMGTLVAFSGEVKDDALGPDGFSERSQTLNPGLNGDIREAFKGTDFQILLVANKFQTGFDQPLLCGMYVDRRLDAIQAVQTLSRLNRCFPGKDTTFVVDFVNDPQDILAAFKTYYATAELADVIDRNLILNLKTKLDALNYYDEFEIDRFVKVLLDSSHSDKIKPQQHMAVLDPVAQRLKTLHKEARLAYRHAEETNDSDGMKRAKEELDALTLFRRDLGTYVRFYTFLSQIFDDANTSLEKRALFYKALLPLLDFERDSTTIDLSKVVLTRHRLRDLGTQKLDLTTGDAIPIPGLAPGGGGVRTKDKAELAEIIAKLNEIFGSGLPEEQLTFAFDVIPTRVRQSALLRQQAAANSKEQFANSPDFDQEMMEAIIGPLDAHRSMSTQVLNSREARAGLKDLLLNHTCLYEDLRNAA